MIKILKENKSIYWVWLTMVGIISISVIITPYLSLVAFFIFIIYSIFKPINHSCVLLFGLLPFANLFKIEAGVTSLFTICELIVVILAVIKERKIKWDFLISLLLFIAYISVLSIGNFNILTIIKQIIGFYLIYLVTSKANKKDVIHIAYLLSASVILMMVLSLNETYFQYIEPYLTDLNYLANSPGSISKIMRSGGFLGDPNYCSMLIIITVSLLCSLYYHHKIKTEFWIYIAFLIPLGFFTYSKSYLLCISALILFLFLFVLLPKHRGWAVVFSLTMVIVVSMALSGKIEVINLIVERFTSGDITTGRTALNKAYLTYIRENPKVLFFGEGIGADRISTLVNNVHNIYIEGLFKLGIVGCIFYVFALAFSVRYKTNIKSKRKLADFIPLAFVLVLFCVLAGITMYELPFYVSIAVLALNFNSLNENNLNDNNLVRR